MLSAPPEPFYRCTHLQPYRFFDVAEGRHEGMAGNKSLHNKVRCLCCCLPVRQVCTWSL